MLEGLTRDSGCGRWSGVFLATVALHLLGLVGFKLLVVIRVDAACVGLHEATSHMRFGVTRQVILLIQVLTHTHVTCHDTNTYVMRNDTKIHHEA